MNNLYFVPIILVLLLVIPYLVSIAFVTVAERKTMASMQRRVGPNSVGLWGLLQAFADALKLLLKEYVAPSQSNIILFFLGPIITLIFSLLVSSVIPFGPGVTIYDTDLSILYILALSSLSSYGILLAGWSANSKYAFLGSLRSTAQLISYELILTSAILIVIIYTGSLNIIISVETQTIIWYLIPLFPAFIMFFIGSIAETNRAPFDLAEAESELVSGFMTEHSSVIFVFFFLAEYGSILFMCMLVSILYLGGYLYIEITKSIKQLYDILAIFEAFFYNNIYAGTLFNPLSLSIKSCCFIFGFIWVRAAYPRIRYDQLMSYCWVLLLPIAVALIIYLPSMTFLVQIYPISTALLGFIPIKSKNANTTDNNTFIKKLAVYTLLIVKMLLPVIIVVFIKCITQILTMEDLTFDILTIINLSDNILLTEGTTEGGSTEVGGTEKPSGTTEKPSGTTEKPSGSSDKPEGSSNDPEKSDDKSKKKPEKGTFIGALEGLGNYYPPAGGGWGWGG